jgi:hypothetical protein
MTRRTTLGLVLVAGLFCGGCGTVDNLKRPTFPPPNRPDAKVVRIYGGVRGDWTTMTTYDWTRTTSYIDYVLIPVLAAIDLALDVGADTVTLPITVVAEVRRAVGKPPAEDPDSPSLPPPPAPARPSPPAAPQPLPAPQPGPPPAAGPVASTGPAAGTPPASATPGAPLSSTPVARPNP